MLEKKSTLNKVLHNNGPIVVAIVYRYKTYFSQVPICCEFNKACNKNSVRLQTFNWSIKKPMNIWISAFEKNGFLRNIWFSAHLLSQSKCGTSLKFLPNFHNYWRSASVVSLASQIPILDTAHNTHYFSSYC